ncbi:hypothetical protein [Streptomyces griseosporeus]|uniref:hypothetical protein n=1 Tax=Streptomyces griseosporeus TaxID=1910 RepID=UPI0036F9DD95
MTSSRSRSRTRRRAASHIPVRVAHTVLGAAAAVLWLVLPGMTTATDPSVAITRPGPSASAASAAPEEDETSPADLVLPVLAVGAAGAFAGYAYVRRRRRARTRTTPAAPPASPGTGSTGSAPGAVLPPRPYEPSLAELDRQAAAALVAADDCVRAAREELGFAARQFDAGELETYERAVREAEAELAAALRMRQRYDDGVPAEEAARRHALAGIVGRCAEAGRRLDAQAAGFDALRALEGGTGAASAVAEGRFRELTARTAEVEATLTGLGERYAPAATGDVVGYLEQAKDRLVFATSRLNLARQAADLGKEADAAARLRAAEGAIAQAGVFVDAVGRLTAELGRAGELLAPALTGAEAELSAVRAVLPPAREGREAGDAGMGAMAGAAPAPQDTAPPEVPGAPDVPPGELRSRVLHADAVLDSVRQEVTGGRPYDPLAVLRRVVAALAPVATGRAGVLAAAARLTAGSAVAGAEAFVATHRGAVGAAPRTLLAAARDLLDADGPSGARGLPALVRADALARRSRDLAEQDVRLHGTPSADTAGDPDAGAAGAVLGGILLSGGTPPRFGGPQTRARLG